MKPHATHDDAVAGWPCPLARLFSTPTPNCRGCDCPLWRWTTGTAFTAAVKALGERIEDKPPYAKASALVSANPADHGLHGYCGLGGPL